MQNSTGVSAELQSLTDGRRFDATGARNADGKFVFDDEVEVIGPFIVFEADGLAARFIGLRDRVN